ncbi:MAG: hypothetical protein B6D41_14005 [Chloroflexi bacterium UTCFX4]|nr:MAG: hypothetical protein B6D41_14005 [Chloroflexi bacterium UTCFX4]
MYSILIADPIAAEGVQILERAHRVRFDPTITADALRDAISNYDALIVRSRTQVTAALIDAAERTIVMWKRRSGAAFTSSTRRTASRFPSPSIRSV